MKKKIVRFINGLDIHYLIAGGVIAVFIVSCIVQCVLLEQINSKLDRIEAALNQSAAVSEIEILVSETDSEPKEDFAEIVSLGEFELTAYCACSKCCGIWSKDRPLDSEGVPIVYGSSGERLVEGYSVAVDPSVIPYGTEIIIDGKTYIAHDCGGAIKGNRIDIYFASHKRAVKFGRQTAEVFQIISEG